MEPKRSATASVPVAHPWTGRMRGGLVGNWIFAQVLRFLGLRAANALLVPVAAYFLLAAPAAVRASRDYGRRIRRLGGAWPPGLWGVYRHFLTFGKILLDRIAMIRGPAGRFAIAFDGEDRLRSALAAGRGLVLVSGHVGNWEGAAHLLGRLGRPVNIVAYEGEVEHLRAFFDRLLGDRAFGLISADGSAASSLAIMAALSRGEIVAMHADRPMGQAHDTVPFLGSPVRFPVGPFVVAALSRAPLVHAFAMREGAYRYTFHAYPAERPVFSDRDGRRDVLRGCVRRFAAHLEETLRRYPLQWLNLYAFWGGTKEART